MCWTLIQYAETPSYKRTQHARARFYYLDENYFGEPNKFDDVKQDPGCVSPAQIERKKGKQSHRENTERIGYSRTANWARASYIN